MGHTDYVVVGAGSAGCALAARLSEHPEVRVTVLEAGGSDTHEAIPVPQAWPALWGTEDPWAYETVPQPGSSGQVHAWPRGRVLGGSSSLNGMVYIRANPRDWDAWAYDGCDGWDHESLLPVMRRMEDVPKGDPRFRGVGGPIEPRPAASPNPISTAFVEAARELGYPVTDDFNGERFEGAGFHDLLIKDGRRTSAAVTYLHPATGRANLEVITGAHVVRVLLAGGRCTGVEFVQDGELRQVQAEREVVLCAGAIDSPAVLLRSGIGPAAELGELGIEPVADVPGVGRNLHDHLLMGVIWDAAQPVPPPEYNLAESSMFLRSHPDKAAPDLHFMFIHVPFHLPTYEVPAGAWTIAVGLVRPASRGTVRLRSAAPEDKPLIDPAYLTQDADVEAMVRGTRLARELAAANAFDPWRGPEVLPGPAVQSDAEIEDFVRHAAGTYYHPVGTCRMGAGPDAVVDPALRVRGLRGLRVADASVMPSIVSANTNTASMIIGERAADLLRAGAPTPVTAGRPVVGREEMTTFAPPRITAERRDDGAIVLRSAEALEDHAPSLAHAFRAGAARHPERVLAARADGTRLTWGEARARADAVGEGLLARGLGPERPLMVLSGKPLEHLTLMLGAYTAGVPIVPLSTAYSLLSRDHERIRAAVALCAPGLVYADDAEAYGRALEVATEGGAAIASLDELTAGEPGERVEGAFAALGPDTVAKILLTSGSTGTPKGVLSTHRMLCSNQAALGQVWPFLAEEPPVLVDWLPWSHTFGGNHNVGQVIAFGGTLHIDDGKPAPQLFGRTVAALREVRPTAYYNVPAGWALLAAALEEDPQLADAFFSRLRFMFYAGASLPESLWERLRALAARHAGRPVPLTASWGTTETAPAATTAHFDPSPCGCIGVPIPGTALKLVPSGGRLEVRVAGPNVTPGYHGDPATTASAFDEEGFYRSGDAVRLVDPEDPSRGLMFDGRLAENFKLTTGTWVRVGPLRTALVSHAQVLRDAVIAGHDREFVAALAWLNPSDAQRVGGSDAVRSHLEACLARLNEGEGSATRIERLLVLEEPPDIDAGEITDKGYINQRAVLERRAADVARLYADPPGADVLTARAEVAPLQG